MLYRARRWPLAILLAALTLAIGVVAGWAVTTVMRPAEDPLEASSFTYATVAEGEVGSSMPLTTTAEWPTHPSGRSQASGVITTVAIRPGQVVTQGDVLYSVNLRPVIIAEGTVPSFRSITRGVSGDDVTQLQTLLGALGFYDGPADGKAEAGTESAIRAWQDSLGLEPTGTVEVSDLIFVPDLPSRITLNPEFIVRGGTLTGGESVVESLPSVPSLTAQVKESQATSIPAGTRVEITSPGGSIWHAYAGEQIRDPESQTVTITLTGKDDGSVCLELCDEIQITGQSRLNSRVITTESVTGLVVPSAAIITKGQSGTALIDDSGTEIPVTIVASSRGMSVVEGVELGTRVRMPNTTEGSS